MRPRQRTSVAVAVVIVGVLGTWRALASQAGGAGTVDTAALAARVAALEAQVGLVQDVQDIYNLQNAYGYYLDKKLWDDVADLFTDDAVVEINARGVYKGGKSVRTLFKNVMGGGVNGLAPGTLHNHMQLQGVVHVDPGGQTAKGRWRAFIQIGAVPRDDRPGVALWAEGPYEIEYRKVNRKWMFSTMRWDPTYFTGFHDGWDKPATGGAVGTGVSKQFPPDALPSRQITPYPETSVLPFHYNNPVTGKATVILGESK